MTDSEIPPPRHEPAPDYAVFRRMADWAAGTMDHEILFHYRADGTLAQTRGPREPGGDPALTVPVRNPGRAHRVASVRIGNAAGRVQLAEHADAVFWSEAAVEKFVLPYYASLGAGRAAAAMAQLMGAWAGAPGSVDVLAVTHASRPATAVETGVGDLLGIVYTEAEGPPRHLPLSRFLERYRPDLLEHALTVPNPPAPAPARLPLARPNAPAGSHDPDRLELRVMAEWASSFRDDPVYLVYDASRPPDPAHPYRRIQLHHALPAELRGRIVIPSVTPALRPGRPVPKSVAITPWHSRGEEDGASEVEVAFRADAAFWSTGAVERLLMPYYAQVYGGASLRGLRRMFEAWWGSAPGEVGRERNPGATAEAFALLHLPNSDWTTAASPVEAFTGVLYADGGTPRAPRLAGLGTFLAEHPQAAPG